MLTAAIGAAIAASFVLRSGPPRAGKLLAKLEGHEFAVCSLAFSPDGRVLATGSADKTARLWDVASRATIAKLEGHGHTIMSLAFAPDGKTLATASGDATIFIWDVTNVASPKRVATLSGHTKFVQSIAFSPDGKTLASGGADSTIRLWDVASAKLLLTHEAWTDDIRSVAFAPDGRVASGSVHGRALLWPTTKGAPTKLEPGDAEADADYYVNAVAYSPDKQILATASDLKRRGAPFRIRLWDASSLKPIATREGGGSEAGSYALSFSSDGKLLATGGAKLTTVWSVPRLGVVARCAFPNSDDSSLGTVAFSPDGKTLATTIDYAVLLWDVAP